MRAHLTSRDLGLIYDLTIHLVCEKRSRFWQDCWDADSHAVGQQSVKRTHYELLISSQSNGSISSLHRLDENSADPGRMAFQEAS